MKNKVLNLGMLFSFLTVFTLNVYAAACPSECRSEEGVPDNAYCVDAEGPEGSKKCDDG